MSRVRFDSIDAISKISNVIYSGVGWSNYNKSKTVNENIKFLYNNKPLDLIVVYKPASLIGFAEVEVLKCIRYNEMWDINGTTDEIVKSKVNIVMAHHLNDIPHYNHIKNVKFEHIPHSANVNIFKDYQEEKKYDVLLTGAICKKHYPFRCRLVKIIKEKLSKVVNCKILSHPGGNLKKLKGFAGDNYARELNRSKLVLTCSSKYKYRLGKYVEIPMCASMLAADLPNQDQDEFSKFMLVLKTSDSDDVIINKIVHYVKNDEERNARIRIGLDWAKGYTQEMYANRFISFIEYFLGGRQ